MDAAFEPLRRQYPRRAKDLLGPLLGLLAKAREACAGDMDTALILLVLAIRAAEHPEFAGLSYQRVETGDLKKVPSLPINVRSLAESMGMPKETVRRKVQALIRHGLIVREGRSLRYAPAALVTLSPVCEAIIRQAVANHATVETALRAAANETMAWPNVGPMAGEARNVRR